MIGKNAYVCDTCGEATVTRQAEEGTTPFMIQCTRCANGIARSTMGATSVIAGTSRQGFRTIAVDGLEPTHEWYRPTLRSARNLGPQMYEHVRLGGLLLRPINATVADVVSGRTKSLAVDASRGGQTTKVDAVEQYVFKMFDTIAKLEDREQRRREAIVVGRIIRAFVDVNLISEDEGEEYVRRGAVVVR